jgi:type I restriction enzyme R subunit
VAEVIENNVRRLIIDEQPINPKYYEKMSQLLDALIQQRRQEALDYQKYLERIVELTRQIKDPAAGGAYPKALNTPGRRALYDNLDRDEAVALGVDGAVRASRQDDWRSNAFKIKRVKNAIRAALDPDARRGPDEAPSATGTRETHGWGQEGESPEQRVERILELIKNQDEY